MPGQGDQKGTHVVNARRLHPELWARAGRERVVDEVPWSVVMVVSMSLLSLSLSSRLSME